MLEVVVIRRILLPSADMSPVRATAQVLVSFSVMCTAFLVLINPDGAQEILRQLIAVIVGTALLTIGMRYLWSSTQGRMVAVGVLVIAGICLKHGSARE